MMEAALGLPEGRLDKRAGTRPCITHGVAPHRVEAAELLIGRPYDDRVRYKPTVSDTRFTALDSNLSKRAAEPALNSPSMPAMRFK